MKTITIRAPRAIYTNVCDRYVGLPIKFGKGTSKYDFADAFSERVSELAGEGHKVVERDGFRTFDLLFIDGESANRGDALPPGDWIVRYTLDPENASSVDAVWVAAKIEGGAR